MGALYVNNMDWTGRDLYVFAEGGKVVAGPFKTNAEAWAWVDRNEDEGRADTDRANRIRDAFAG